MQLLNQAGFHWNSRTPTRLEYENHSIACTLYQDGGHIFFNNPHIESNKNTTLMARLAYEPDPHFRTITEESLHKILAHASSEVMSRINGPDYKINLIRSQTTPKASKCVTSSLSKSKRIISRQARPEIPRTGRPFHTLCWDAITMEEAFNGVKYISHFYCPDSHFNFIFTCKSKTDFKLTIRTVMNLIKNQWKYDVQVFQLDGETSLIQECKNLTTEQGIRCHISAADTPEQNGAAERSGGVIIVKARAMSLEASIPTNI